MSIYLYLREIVKQKVNILMKIKLGINFNRKSDKYQS